MRRPSKERRYIWLWVGAILLSISALFWVVLIIWIVAEPEDAVDIILGGLVFSIIPIGVGIYYVRRGKRRYKRRVYFLRESYSYAQTSHKSTGGTQW